MAVGLCVYFCEVAFPLLFQGKLTTGVPAWLH